MAWAADVAGHNSQDSKARLRPRIPHPKIVQQFLVWVVPETKHRRGCDAVQENRIPDPGTNFDTM